MAFIYSAEFGHLREFNEFEVNNRRGRQLIAERFLVIFLEKRQNRKALLKWIFSFHNKIFKFNGDGIDFIYSLYS